MPLRAVENLKMAAYYVHHHARISQVIIPGMITLANVRALSPLKDHEESHEQPKDSPVLNKKDMVKSMDAIDSYLGSYLGEKKVPLAYVIRQEVEVTPSTDDPPANCATVKDQMVSRAPHLDADGMSSWLLL